MDFVHRPDFYILENTTFWKLDLFPSSADGSDTPTTMGTSGRANFSPWTLRFLVIQNSELWTKSINPANRNAFSSDTINSNRRKCRWKQFWYDSILAVDSQLSVKLACERAVLAQPMLSVTAGYLPFRGCLRTRHLRVFTHRLRLPNFENYFYPEVSSPEQTPLCYYWPYFTLDTSKILLSGKCCWMKTWICTVLRV
jgi:hypothetical protein